MTDWQPIETAPKDGTPILLFYPGPDYDSGNYHSDGEAVGVTMAVVRGRTTANGYLIWEGYYSAVDPSYATPTHWMPLPEPPTEGPNP
jgi:hypothetical protein